MSKFNIVYSFFFIFTSLILVNNSIKSKELKANQTIDMKSIEGNKEEKGGLKEIDLNNDGKIDYFEFQEIRQRRFDRLDLNNDNIITQEEFEKSLEELDTALQINPKSKWAFLWKGIIYGRRERKRLRPSKTRLYLPGSL